MLGLALGINRDLSKLAWTPAQLTTALWLDAADSSTITESGGAVSQWDDKSGNNNHATQGTGSSQPTTSARNLNGQNVLDFSSDFMRAPVNIDSADQPNMSFFVVFAQDVTTGSMALFGADDGGWDRIALLNSDVDTGVEWGVSNGAGTTAFEPTRTPDTDPHILSWISDAGVASASGVSLDGENPTNFTESLTSTTLTDMGIGARNQNGNRLMDGFIAEIVVLNTTVDTSDRQLIEGYLAHKWGLVGNLPVGHPYKTSPPTV